MDTVNTTEEITTIEHSAPQQTIKKTTTQPIGDELPQKKYQKQKVIFRTYQIIWYILGIIEVLLVFRMALKALGANPGSGFTSMIYVLSDPLANPFAGIFGISVSQGMVFEWSTIIAGVVYLLIAYGFIQLMQLIKPTSPEEVEQTVNNP